MQSCVHSFFFVFLPDRPTHLHEEGGGGGGGGEKKKLGGGGGGGGGRREMKHFVRMAL